MSNYIKHHGILGQKWGVRRYQNEDGSLTPKGKIRQAKQELRVQKRYTVNEDGSLEKKKMSTSKKVAIGVGAAAAATGAAVIATGTILQSKKHKALTNSAKELDKHVDGLRALKLKTKGFKQKKQIDDEILNAIGKSRNAWSNVGKNYESSGFLQLKDKTLAQLSIYLLRGASTADKIVSKFSKT